MIIYFTGTGNSRYLANVLGERLHDEVVDAASLIQKNEYPSFDSETPYVFVAPVYAWRLPRVFEEWIQKCAFSGNMQAYFVLSCGSDIGNAGKFAELLCEGKGFLYMGIAEIVMPENYLALFPIPSERTVDKIIKAAAAPVDAVARKISATARFEPVRVDLSGRVRSGIVNRFFYRFIVSAKKFYATDACISCGKCVKDCMLNNIALEAGKPSWRDNCTHCMACICKCPTEAIEYGKKTKGKRRYVCPK